MRIDKFLGNLKYGTRSEIKDRVAAGEIVCNDVPVTDAAMNIDPDTDRITVVGEQVFYKPWIYLMMNKPTDVVSANKDAKHRTVIDLIHEPYSRFDLDLCGRLDIDTQGLMLLTNDGELLHQVINPKKDVEKVYEVELAKPLKDAFRLEKGIQILDGKDQPFRTKPARILPISEKKCQIAITEGKFHQVKRMFEAIGNEVVSLKRISIGGLFLDPTLWPGQYKELSFSEVEAIFR
jgi:16S rRNA pseudouridine516 synthase